MVTSKIVLLLRKFSKRDAVRFREYVRSSYFNSKKKLIQFYDELSRHAPDFDEKRINKKAIYSKLYPASLFNPQVYKNLSSELYSLARDFVALQYFSRQSITIDLSLLKGLEQMEADELYKTELKTIKNKLSKLRFHDFLSFYKFDLAVIEKSFFYNRGNFRKGNDVGTTESDELLKFYLINLFRQRFDFEISRLNLNIQYGENAAMHHMQSIMEKGTLEETVRFMCENKTKNHEIIAMFYYILMSLINILDDDCFNKAKELAFTSMRKFDRPMRFIITSSLLTVCTFKINRRGSKQDYKNAFEIINFQLKRKIYRETPESHITATEFRSYFMIGLNLKEYEWLKSFLRKYISEVAPLQSQSLENLLKGMLMFHEKEYDKALQFLNNVSFDLFIYKLDVKKLQLLIYYDQGHIENALSSISAYREFLSTNRFVTEETKKNNLNLLHHVSKLIKLKAAFDETDLRVLESELQQAPYMLYKSWFEEKIEDLKTENKISTRRI